LDAAKDWGTPPWKIAGGSKLLWIVRHKVYRSLLIEVRAKIKKGMIPNA